MLDLAGILHYVDIKDANTNASGIYFKGPRSFLYSTPYQEEEKNVRWHVIWDENSTIISGWTHDGWAQILDLDVPQSSISVFANCPKAAILLGTSGRLDVYPTLGSSRANQDRPSPEIALATASISINAAGFVTVQLASGINYKHD
jgi:hypothetical protein